MSDSKEQALELIAKIAADVERARADADVAVVVLRRAVYWAAAAGAGTREISRATGGRVHWTTIGRWLREERSSDG